MTRVGITGSNGYIGSLLLRRFRRMGWHVTCLQRSEQGPSDCSTVVPFDLTEGVRGELREPLECVVHCAFDFRPRSLAGSRAVNLTGLQRLWDQVSAAGACRIVHISSMSAYAGTDQIYGRVKIECEDFVSSIGGVSLRLGLVHGGDDRGMIGSLRRVARARVIPQLRPDSHQFLVHADDVAEGVASVVATPPEQPDVVGLAHPDPVPFSAVIRSLHFAQSSTAPWTVPLPSSLLYRALRLAEATGTRTGFRADSLLGLMRPAPSVPNYGFWAERGIALRPFPLLLGPATADARVAARLRRQLRK
jgi:nucleoside-diphosphate-sugar epimerase